MKLSTFRTCAFAAALFSTCPLTSADDGVAVEAFKLTYEDAAMGDRFGNSVAISGDIAIVGCDMRSTPFATQSGTAYLYNTSTGEHIAQLIPSDPDPWSHFGLSVAISGKLAIVGSPWADQNGDGSGIVYIFDSTSGEELGKLLPADNAEEDRFGYSIAINGNTVIVGARKDDDNGINSGSAYLFDVSDPANPVEVAKLLPTDEPSLPCDIADGFYCELEFGYSVALGKDIAVVGAPHDSEVWSQSGAVYVFDAETGAELSKIHQSNAQIGDIFGHSIAISGDTVVVGAPHKRNGSITRAGRAYLFDVSDPMNPIEFNELLANDGAEHDELGESVSIHHETVVLGTPWRDDMGNESGAAYLFDVNTGAQLAKLLPSDGAELLHFGHSVSINGSTAIIGARGGIPTWPATTLGAAYVFELELNSNAPGFTYCFGDGTNGPCPCDNSGDPNKGCANSMGPGAQLIGVGSTSLTIGNFALWTTGLPPGPGLYYQGDNAANHSFGVSFGDGLRCAGGNVVRLDIRLSTGGLSRTTSPIGLTGGASAGQTKRYQLWYRDANNSPCGSQFNLSNGYELTWTP